jgi:vancomycin permeability regulator SanA
MHSGDVSIPKIMDVFRSMQGTVVEQMFHNQRTLHDIMEMRQDNICNEVTYLLFFSTICVPYFECLFFWL